MIGVFFPERVNFLLKKDGGMERWGFGRWWGETEAMFFLFLLLEPFNYQWVRVVGWDRKSYLGLLNYLILLLLVLINNEGLGKISKVSSLLFLVLIKEMIRQGELKISLHGTRGSKILLEFFANC